NLVVGYRYNLVTVLLDDVKGDFAGSTDRDTIGNGCHIVERDWLACHQRGRIRRSFFCLHPDHVDMTSLLARVFFDSYRCSGQQAPTTDTQQHGIDVWLLLNDFLADCSMTGYALRVIQGVNKRGTGFFSVSCGQL